ncbi:MAG: MarR family winged helix-turn-helix transcriptional regulator [Acidimicrobiales bacterium]
MTRAPHTTNAARGTATGIADQAAPGVTVQAAASIADQAVAVDAVRALARVARLLERASGDLGLAQYRVISAIAGGEDRAARVAERVGLGRPAVSAAVEALCRSGLVRRTEAASDQRAIDLAVTPDGWLTLDRVEAAMVQLLADLCDRCSRSGIAAIAGAGTSSSVPGEALSVLAALGPAMDDQLAEHRQQRRSVGR